MKKITEALKKLLPEGHEDVVAAVTEMVAEASTAQRTQVEAEFNKKLEEAYAEMATELDEASKKAEAGYREAFDVIEGYRQRIEKLAPEYDAALEEAFDQAYQMVETNRVSFEKKEAELYEAYDDRVQKVRDHIVGKFHEFLGKKGTAIYEQARRDVLNDPALAEHRSTLNKVVECVSDYLGEEVTGLTGKKLDESQRIAEDLAGKVRLLEARSIRQSTDINKLNETIREKEGLLKEQAQILAEADRSVRENAAKSASGSGKVVTGATGTTEVIGESNKAPENQDVEDLNEASSIGSNDDVEAMCRLAGI